MPIIKEGVSMPDTDDYVWDIYDQSVKMSTYLLGTILIFNLLFESTHLLLFNFDCNKLSKFTVKDFLFLST